MKKFVVSIVAAAAVACAFAQQPPKRVERAADLPQFTYKVEGQLEAIVRDPQKFSAFAAKVYADTANVLATHDIAELATRRQLHAILMQVDMLEGRWDEAMKHAVKIKELQEKPADKLLSGITGRSIITAAKKTGSTTSPAFAQEVGRLITAELAALPADVVRNDVISIKAGMETIGEGRLFGAINQVLQPVATAKGELSSELAPAMIGVRYQLVFAVPLKPVLVQAYSGWVAANKVDKADIWAARDVTLPEGRNYKPVTIVVWDSGVDLPIFKERVAQVGGKPAYIAFDNHARASEAPLKPIPADLQSRLPSLLARSKGLSDLVSNVDSKEATEVKQLLSTLPASQYKSTVEELRLVSVYQHGTHVAGIAMAGNPYARLANARIDFGHTIQPDPCPTPELVQRSVANYKSYFDFIRASGARVVNMSWGGNVRGYEVALEQCNIGKDKDERRKIAREYFEMARSSLTKAIADMPDVLFVTSAGNSADDPTFNESYPSGIELPNIVAVGAVDKAGDEASFTSYGKTVLLHANGYQVDSYIPGGTRLAISGTSMSSPQVANLAGKILAVNPALKPQEVIAIMRRTAERTPDGRRTLIHPAKALAEAGYKP